MWIGLRGGRCGDASGRDQRQQLTLGRGAEFLERQVVVVVAEQVLDLDADLLDAQTNSVYLTPRQI